MYSSEPYSEYLKEDSFASYRGRLEELYDRPLRSKMGIIALCEQGSVEVTIGSERRHITPRSEFILLPGSIISLEGASPDFMVHGLFFSETLFRDATYRIDNIFFQYLITSPVFGHSESSYTSMQHWMELAEYTYNDKENVFRIQIMRNRLQNLFWEIYDKIRRGWAIQPEQRSSSRRTDLFHLFMDLVRNNFQEHRGVSFYADKLCISTRYLSAITTEAVERSAKEIIDEVLIQEVKLLLLNSSQSIQEIAYALHFPDQSYLGRFFKRHTGISPTRFREES